MRVQILRFAIFLTCAASSGGCRVDESESGPPTQAAGIRQVTPASGEEAAAMQVTSGFANGAKIDRKHTADGPDLSPAISWAGVPEGSKTLALICDDPDAPSARRPGPTPWVHWVIYDIPASVASLPEGIPRTAKPAQVAGAKQGTNSFGSDIVGYRGPAPPPGSGPHRYFFKVYALDTELQLDPAKTTKDVLLNAMKGHILAEGALMGTYER
jgi:Raf kinase inhibitor-like YbhB/YbcL family protein